MSRASEERRDQPASGLLADQVDAGEVPDAERGAGAAGPMLGTFATTGVIQLVQAVIGVLLARILGPEERGELAAVILWPTLLTVIGSLGLAQASTYQAARNSRLGVVVGTTLGMVAAEAVVLVGIGWAILPLVLGDHDAGVVRDGQLFLTVFIPLNMTAVMLMSILNGAHRFGWFQSLRLVLIGATVLGIGLLAATGEMTVGSAAAAYGAANLITAILALGVIFRVTGGDIRFRRETAREMLGFGSKSALSQSMWSLNERADQLVISIFFSATSLGLYVVAVTLTSLTTLIGFSFAVVALPMIAKLESQPERQRLAHLFIVATLVLATAISLPIFVLEPQLIRFFFGADFVDAAGVGRVLLLAGVVFGLNRVMEAILQAVGRPLESSIGEGVALAVTAAGLAVLLPTLGIMGAGITSLLAYSASSAFMIRRASKALEVSAFDLVRPERSMIAQARGLTRLLPGRR